MSPQALVQRLQHALERLPRVLGSGAASGQVYVSARLNDVFNTAEGEARQ